jgi:hypothetical protein
MPYGIMALSLVYAVPGVVGFASLRVFIGTARDADILTAEGKTMNGSAQSGKPSIVLHGVGVQAGASACWRRAGRRSRRRRLWPHIGEWTRGRKTHE